MRVGRQKCWASAAGKSVSWGVNLQVRSSNRKTRAHTHIFEALANPHQLLFRLPLSIACDEEKSKRGKMRFERNKFQSWVWCRGWEESKGAGSHQLAMLYLLLLFQLSLIVISMQQKGRGRDRMEARKSKSRERNASNKSIENPAHEIELLRKNLKLLNVSWSDKLSLEEFFSSLIHRAAARCCMQCVAVVMYEQASNLCGDGGENV